MNGIDRWWINKSCYMLIQLFFVMTSANLIYLRKACEIFKFSFCSYSSEMKWDLFQYLNLIWHSNFMWLKNYSLNGRVVENAKKLHVLTIFKLKPLPGFWLLASQYNLWNLIFLCKSNSCPYLPNFIQCMRLLWYTEHLAPVLRASESEDQVPETTWPLD